MSDIFISYASEDRPRAKSLAHALKAQGWSVWWDRDLPYGAEFHKVIRTELDAARHVIVLWSHVSVEKSWVLNEAAEAEKRGVLIPVVIQKDVRIPLGFMHLHAADLEGWDGDVGAALFQSLVADIAPLLAEKQPREADTEAMRGATGEGTRRWPSGEQGRAEGDDWPWGEAEAQRRVDAVAGAIVVAVGLFVSAVLLLGGDRGGTPALPPGQTAGLTVSEPRGADTLARIASMSISPHDVWNHEQSQREPLFLATGDSLRKLLRSCSGS